MAEGSIEDIADWDLRSLLALQHKNCSGPGTDDIPAGYFDLNASRVHT